MKKDLDWFVQRVGGRKIWFSQVGDESFFIHHLFPLTPTIKNGWPSVTYPGVEPNSPNAVASVAEEAVGAFPMRHLDCSLASLEILHSPGLQVFVLQKSPRGWCRLVRPSLLGLPGTRLRDLGYEHEAQVQLCSQNFVLKGSSNVTIDLSCYSV